jgi:TolA-binding protein/predicted negative regulator of RcsB-dependent stress response
LTAVRPRLFTLLTLGLTLGFCAPVFAADTEADRQYTFAVRLLQQDESKLAEEAFDEFARRFAADPRTQDAEYYLAVLARRRGDLPAALKRLDAVKNPLRVGLGSVRVLRGQIKLESGDTPGAIAELEQVKPDQLPDVASRAAASYLLGAAYRRANNLPGAATQFEQAAAGDSPVRGPAFLELGKARIELKQYPGAFEALNAALAANIAAESAAEARGLAADLAYQQKQYEKAADLYRQVIERHQATPQFGPAVIGLLRSLYAMGQDAELIKQYDASRQLFLPDSIAEAMYLLSASEVRLKQYPQAQAVLTEFYKRFGSDHALSPQIAYLYAVTFYHTDVDGFEKWFVTVEKDLPRMVNRLELLYLRAQAAVKRNKPEEAIRHLTALIAAGDSPYARPALLQRAGLSEQLGHPDEAAADYAAYSQKYGEDPSSADAGRRAIDLAFSTGDFKHAVELADPWLKRPGLDAAAAAPIQLKLALSYIKLNLPDPAMQRLDALIAAKPEAPVAALAQFYRGLLLASRAKAPQGTAADEPTTAALASLQESLKGTLPADQRFEALSLIAQLHRMAGKDDQAIETYEQLRQHREAKDFEPATALWVGRALVQRNKFDTALTWLTPIAAKADAPEAARAEAMFYAGQALQKSQHYKEAIEMDRRLVGFSRGFGDQGRLGLAQSLAAMDQLEDALVEYEGLVNVESSMVAATALYESGLLHLEVAGRLAAAGDKAASARESSDARRRLNRVTLLYDLPQLGPVPIRAGLALAKLDVEAGEPDKAKRHCEAVLARPDAAPWHDIARAELKLIDGSLGDAVFLLRKTAKAADEPSAALARQRLKQLGEQP